ncbi:MAG: DUF1073 domain-containing protein [Desulfobacteraceae bacterium]|nr:DUF1073 domain-containing protein [Desulfobacteraceae bacterium]
MMKNPAKLVVDGFKNILKGLGSSKDPRTQNVFLPGMIIDLQLANNLYTYNWLCAKVVDAPVDDATRKWRNILISDADKKKEVEEVYKGLGIKGAFNQAMKWARVFGGAGIVIIIEGQDPGEPLEIENIGEGSLKNLIVLDRYNLISDQVNRDIMSENFGQPEFYTVVRSGIKIHHSRVIKFFGELPTIFQAEQNHFWGLSVFSRMWDPISESQQTSNSIGSLIYESNIDVYRIAGLNQLVAEGKDDLVVKRLKIAHEMKSTINGIVLDKEDEYEKKQNRFSDLANIDDRFIQKVSGSSGIPVTRLIGISPAGMNATGESDMNNYYDEVQSKQENDIRPRLDYMDKIVMASAFPGEEPFEYVFNPLQQVSETDQAEIEVKKATRDQTYLDQGVIQPSDAMAELAENGTYISIDETSVEDKKKEEAEELELEEPDLILQPQPGIDPETGLHLEPPPIPEPNAEED